MRTRDEINKSLRLTVFHNDKSTIDAIERQERAEFHASMNSFDSFIYHGTMGIVLIIFITLLLILTGVVR